MKRSITRISNKIIEKNIGYLRLKAFNNNSSNQLVEKINKFELNDKPVGYILDLRNNPGGLLTQAINVTDFFLNNGEIVSTKGRRLIENRRFFAKKGDKGMTIVGKNNFVKHIEAHSVENPDVTGAGDTVIAALSLAFAKTKDIEISTTFASAAAAVVVGKTGTATVTIDEINNYISIDE